MRKKILLTVGIIIAIIVGIGVVYLSKERNEPKNNIDNLVQNEIELSSKYVKDDCINEWHDYSISIQEEIQETSQNLNDATRKYILKGEEGVIKVYYINEKKEEILYKVTDISLKFLGIEDIYELNEGIEVEGIQELNKLLEDFES